MKNWKETEITVGKFRQKSIIRATFEGEDNMDNVRKIHPHCGKCTDYVFDYNTKKLHVTIKSGSLPLHLKVSGKDQTFSKKLTVTYVNGKTEELTVIGIKTK
jgi:regulator of sigma D